MADTRSEPSTTSPLAKSAIISAANAPDSATVALLIPRSLRIDDSECKPLRRAVLRIWIGSKLAASINTFVVFSSISVSNPPITPASAMGFSPSVMTISESSKGRSTSSSVTIRSPSLARRVSITLWSNLS